MKNISGLTPVSLSPILSETRIAKSSEISFQALLNTKMQPLHTTKADVEVRAKDSTLPTLVNRPDLDGLVAQLLASRKMLMNTTSKLCRPLSPNVKHMEQSEGQCSIYESMSIEVNRICADLFVMQQTAYPTTPFIYYYIWIPVPFIELKVGFAKARKLNRKKLNPLQILQPIKGG